MQLNFLNLIIQILEQKYRGYSDMKNITCEKNIICEHKNYYISSHVVHLVD